MLRFANSCLFLFLLTFNFACRSSNSADKIAQVDGIVITQKEVDRAAGKALYGLREQLHRVEVQKLDEYIGATLLTREAEKKGVSVSTLLEQEVNAQVPAISEADIEAFYNQNKARLQVGMDKVHDQIRDYMREQKIAAQKNEFIKALRAKANVTTYLKAPEVYRVDVPITGAFVRGADKAPVTIVKFEDFQCPYCKIVQPTFSELLKRYNGKIRVIHKDLPLDAIHPLARPAAEAARCAGEQGKFWDYHDKLYSVAPKLASEDLKGAAKEVGLDVASFEQCVAGGKFKGAVQKDLLDGAQLGLNGTPAFFINGREISGAQPVEAFAAMIDEELAQAK